MQILMSHALGNSYSRIIYMILLLLFIFPFKSKQHVILTILLLWLFLFKVLIISSEIFNINICSISSKKLPMTDSSSQAIDSSPKNTPSRGVIQNDVARYHQKGTGLIFAAITTFVYFVYVPQIFKAFWPYLLKNLPASQFVLLITVVIHSGSYIIPNLGMYFIYVSKLPFFERYRVSEKPWPWETDKQLWNKLMKKTLRREALFHFIFVPLLTIMDLRSGLKMRIDMESFPSVLEVTGQVLFFMLSEDFFFYWSHRLIHHPKIYPYVHKTHHEYNITVSISSGYCSIPEFIITNLVNIIVKASNIS